jgi:hypothetical protein
MTQQMPLTMIGYFEKKKKTRRAQFLDDMDKALPWTRLCERPAGNWNFRASLDGESALRH